MPDVTKGAVTAIIKNTFASRRFEKNLSEQAFALITAAYNEALVAVAKTDIGLASISTLKRELAAIMSTGFGKVATLTAVELGGYGVLEGKVAGGILDASLRGVKVNINRNVVTKAFIKSTLKNQPMQGALLSSWWKSLGDTTAFNVNRQIQLGIVQNESLQQIRKRLLGSAGQPGLIGGTKRQADAIIRTARNEIATLANFETYKANSDVTSAYQFLATLDERTTDICISFDGHKWAYEDPARRLPPLHVNCRSTIVPIVDWKKLGIDDSKLPTGTRPTTFLPGEPTTITKVGSKTVIKGTPGQVPAHLTYGDFLLQHPENVQAAILGRGKAKLFREGKITLNQLISKEQRSLTLKQLEALVVKNLEAVAKAAAKAAGEIPVVPKLATGPQGKVGRKKLTLDETVEIAEDVWVQMGDTGIIPSIEEIMSTHNIARARAAEIRFRVLGVFDDKLSLFAEGPKGVKGTLEKTFSKPALPKSSLKKISGVELDVQQIESLAKELLSLDAGLVNTPFEISAATDLTIAQAKTVKAAARKLQKKVKGLADDALPGQLTQKEIEKLAENMVKGVEGSGPDLAKLPDEFFKTNKTEIPHNQIAQLKQALAKQIDLDDMAEQWAKGKLAPGDALAIMDAGLDGAEWKAAQKIAAETFKIEKLAQAEKLANMAFEPLSDLPGGFNAKRILKLIEQADSSVDMIEDVLPLIGKLQEQYVDEAIVKFLQGTIQESQLPKWVPDLLKPKIDAAIAKKAAQTKASKIPGAAEGTGKTALEAPKSLEVFLKYDDVITDATKVAGPTGSNTGGVSGVWEGKAGKFYVKEYAVDGQAYAEAVANRIYADLGIDVAETHLVVSPKGRLLHVSRYIDDVEGTLGKVATSDDAFALAQKFDDTLDGFVADVLTVNRDAVGTGLDNIIVKGGKTIRIDQGGAFHFRAQGAAKTGFEGNIAEWETLFTKNPHYKSVFDGAGIAGPDSTVGSWGQRAISQIDDVLALQAKSGGWESYVAEFGSDLLVGPVNRAKIVKTLNERTQLLKVKRAELVKVHGEPKVKKFGGQEALAEAKAKAKKELVDTVAPEPFDLNKFATEVAEIELKTGKKMTKKAVLDLGVPPEKFKSVKISAGAKKKKILKDNLPPGGVDINANPVFSSMTEAHAIQETILTSLGEGMNPGTIRNLFQLVDKVDEVKANLNQIRKRLSSGNFSEVLSDASKLGAKTTELTDLSTIKGLDTVHLRSNITEAVKNAKLFGGIEGPSTSLKVPVGFNPIVVRMANGELVFADDFSERVALGLRSFGVKRAKVHIIDAIQLVKADPARFGFLDPARAAKIIKKKLATDKKLALEHRRKIRDAKKAGPSKELVAEMRATLNFADRDAWRGIVFDEHIVEYRLTAAPKGIKKDLSPRKFKQTSTTVTEKDLRFNGDEFSSPGDSDVGVRSWGDKKGIKFSEKSLDRSEFGGSKFQRYADTVAAEIDDASILAMLQDFANKSSFVMPASRKSTSDALRQLYQKLASDWSGSSVDNNPALIAFHHAVEAEFAIGKQSVVSLARAGQANIKGKALFDAHERVLRRMAREVYNETQDLLKKDGIEWMNLTRWGDEIELKGATREGAIGIFEGQPLSSFGAKPVYGDQWSMTTRIHRSEVFAHFRSGFGTREELEFVVLGFRRPAVAWSYHPTFGEVKRTFKRLGIFDEGTGPKPKRKVNLSGDVFEE